MTTRGTLVLGGRDIERLLTMEDCIAAVEDAFCRHARGESIAPGVLGTHVDGGGFHVKTAGLRVASPGTASEQQIPRFARDDNQAAVYAAKINANFPGNPRQRGLPTIQGVLALFDATDGRVLAIMDSVAITSLRTAAATAVAAKFLAPPAANVTLCGCGEQSRHQLEALACVRRLERVWLYDIARERAQQLAEHMSSFLRTKVGVVDDIQKVAAETSVWITCTPSHRWFLGRQHVAPGAFVAAVGADNPEKQEIEPELLAASAVVADVIEQCATIGDLHHALDTGVMRREDVRADLASIVSTRTDVRHSPDEIVIFDSTGTALEDVAAAAMVYDRAMQTGDGSRIELRGSSGAIASREPLHA